MKRTLIALVLAGLVPGSVAATGVVAFRTPERVVLAADSAMTHWDTEGEVISVDPSGGCKLDAAGGWFFVWGGHRAGGTSVDLPAAFRRVLAPARSLADVSPALGRFVRDNILSLDWRQLPMYLKVGRVVFWVAVGRVTNGTPELGIYRAYVSTLDPVGLRFTAATCPGDCTDGRRLGAGQAAA